MIITETKSDVYDEHGGDLPPAYDALSVHQPGRSNNPYGSLSAFPEPVAGPSRAPDQESLRPALNANKSLPPPPPALKSPSTIEIPSSPRTGSPVLPKRPRARKNISWLSLLPFTSSFSAKRVRRSVLAIVNDLVVSPSRPSFKEHRNVHDTLASLADTCAEHKLALSTLLQEPSIADHTPIYWAVVNYREELLVALLLHSRPLSVQAASDARSACLVRSNQALFHALRVCQPPFHTTDGIRVASLQTAAENLLLGHRPSDEVRIQQSSDQGFIVSFDVTLWLSRMKAIGNASIEFIVCGRMWSLTFFSAYPSSPNVETSGKMKKGKSTWYVMVSLLESSPPTFFDSQLVLEMPSSLRPAPARVPMLRDTRSITLLSARDKHPTRSSMYDDGMGHERLKVPVPQIDVFGPSSGSHLPPPIHPLRGSPSSPRLSKASLQTLSVRLQAGSRKLGRRSRSGEPSKTEAPTTKPDTWSDHGVGYTSAAVSPLDESHAALLLCEHSQYLFPDGTLRGRLEARLTKSESSKDCIIC